MFIRGCGIGYKKNLAGQHIDHVPRGKTVQVGSVDASTFVTKILNSQCPSTFTLESHRMRTFKNVRTFVHEQLQHRAMALGSGNHTGVFAINASSIDIRTSF